MLLHQSHPLFYCLPIFLPPLLHKSPDFSREDLKKTSHLWLSVYTSHSLHIVRVNISVLLTINCKQVLWWDTNNILNYRYIITSLGDLSMPCSLWRITVEVSPRVCNLSNLRLLDTLTLSDMGCISWCKAKIKIKLKSDWSVPFYLCH